MPRDRVFLPDGRPSRPTATPGGSLEDDQRFCFNGAFGKPALASATVNVPGARGDENHAVLIQMERKGRNRPQETAHGSPVVRRRELGVQIRALRLAAGMTIDDVAAELLCSPSKISRLETGQRGASLRDIRDLCELFQVKDDAQREYLFSLVKDQKGQGWWQGYDLPRALATYVGLEMAATSIAAYQPGVIPGLLQTSEYSRAIHDSSFDRLSDAGIDERIQVLQSRQAILARTDPPAPRYHLIIDEAALHRSIGGRAVMTAALEHVVQVSALPNVTIQVLPYSVGAHPALDSTFLLMEFPPPVPPVVYVEGLVGQIYLEGPQDIERYQRVFGHLQTISCDVQQSIELMTRLVEEFKDLPEVRFRG